MPRIKFHFTLLCILIWSTSAHAFSFDFIGTGSALGLSATADFSFVGSQLNVVLTNTSTDIVSGDSSNNILTSLAFNLPSGFNIGGGTVWLAPGSVLLDFPPFDGNVSQEYAYNNTGGAGFSGFGYRNVLTALAAGGSDFTQFATGSLFPPPDLNGPDGGLISDDQIALGFTIGNGQELIQDSIIFKLDLDQDVSLAAIQSGGAIVEFGSDSEHLSPIPEPATALLLGSGLLGLLGLRRRRFLKKS